MKWVRTSLVINLTILLFSCAPPSNSPPVSSSSPQNDGKYDSEFPHTSSTKELKAISQVIKKIYSTITYENHIFNKNRGIKRNEINKQVLKTADDTFESRNTVLGTATVIHYLNKKIAVLSCAHIFDKPDTIVTFHTNEHDSRGIVQSVAVKTRQTNVIPDLPGSGEFEILLMDRKNDIAILGKEFKRRPTWQINTLEFPFGSAKELDWGAFVYVFGFPRGFQMLTRAIVSSPENVHKGEFIIDALFNRGMSGSLVLAIRDGLPNFEVVGITKSAAAEDLSVLIPEQGKSYDEYIPYEDQVFVHTQKRINYGITMVITSEVIIELLKNNEKELRYKGYYIDLPGVD